MADPDLQRLRLVYSKGEAIRYISNLDLMRLWERAARRADLPLAYSHGFNPQAKINNAHALPLGSAGEREVMDLWLKTPLPPDAVAARLRRALPPAAGLHEVRQVAAGEPSLQSVVDAADYRIHVSTSLPDDAVRQKVEKLLSSPSLPRQRQKRRRERSVSYDLRPLVQTLQWVGREGEWAVLRMRLRCAAGATGRPDEVLDAMGLGQAPRRIVRERLYFREAVPEPASTL